MPLPRIALHRASGFPCAQDNESKLAPQFSTTSAGGGSKFSTTTHENKMPPDGYVAEKPGAGGAPLDGANLERMANKDQVNTTQDRDHTLDCGREKVAIGGYS